MTQDMFTSRPLADAQNAVPSEPEQADASTPHAVRPQPIVDMNLDEVPETDYAPFTFQLKGVVYTLGIDDDSILFEVAESSMDDIGPNELFEFFFERTFRSAVDEYGKEVPDGMGHLLRVIDPRPRDGSRPVPRRHLLRIMNSAVEGWMGELTDVSMRPQRRGRRR